MADPGAPRPTRLKGPSSWLARAQQDLDDAYAQAAYAPTRDQLVPRNAHNSDGVRARLGPPERHVYGTSALEALDVYRTRRVDAPVNVFIHGGAWRRRPAKNYAFPAEPFV